MLTYILYSEYTLHLIKAAMMDKQVRDRPVQAVPDDFWSFTSGTYPRRPTFYLFSCSSEISMSGHRPHSRNASRTGLMLSQKTSRTVYEDTYLGKTASHGVPGAVPGRLLS